MWGCTTCTTCTTLCGDATHVPHAPHYVGMHNMYHMHHIMCGCTKVLSCHLFAVMVDVSESVGEGVLCELLYSDDMVLMSGMMRGMSGMMIEELISKFREWKKAFDSVTLKVHGKENCSYVQWRNYNVRCLKLVFSCGICSMRVKAYLVLCVQCGNWVHCRCAGLRR